MNNTVRQQIYHIILQLQLLLNFTELDAHNELINKLVGDIESLADNERDKYSNMSEGLQCSERGLSIEAAADALELARDELEEFNIKSAIENLQEAVI